MIIIILLIILFVWMIVRSNSKKKEPQKTTHYTEPVITGHVYILSNDCFKDKWFKIGMTTRDVEARVKELNTSVPENFYIVSSIPCPNPYAVEQDLHERLDKYRPLKRKEFFKLDYELLKEELNKIDYLNKN